MLFIKFITSFFFDVIDGLHVRRIHSCLFILFGRFQLLFVQVMDLMVGIVLTVVWWKFVLLQNCLFPTDSVFFFSISVSFCNALFLVLVFFPVGTSVDVFLLVLYLWQFHNSTRFLFWSYVQHLYCFYFFNTTFFRQLNLFEFPHCWCFMSSSSFFLKVEIIWSCSVLSSFVCLWFFNFTHLNYW